MGESAIDRRSPYEWIALIGCTLVAALVPLVPARLPALYNHRLDGTELLLPIAVVLAVPFLRRLGAARIPALAFDVPAVAFLLVALLSAVFSDFRSMAVFAWFRYAASLFLAVAVASLATRPANRTFLLWAICASGAVTAVVAVSQFVGAGPANGGWAISPEITSRVVGLFSNPNFYAEYLVLLFGATLALAISYRGLTRYVIVLFILVEMVALALTYTRGSWLALGVAVLVGSAMLDWRLALGFLGGAAVLIALVPGAVTRLTSAFAFAGGAGVRLPLWEMAMKLIAAHPVLGVGTGAYQTALIRAAQQPGFLVGEQLQSAHNAYLLLMAETGIVGGVLFAWLIVRVCRLGLVYGHRAGRTRVRTVNAALTIGILAFALNALTSNSFQHPQAAVFFWLLVGIQTGSAAQLLRKELAAGGTGPAGREVEDSGVRAGLRESALYGWLIGPPRGRGRTLLDSRAGRFLFGRGSQRVGPDADALDEFWPVQNRSV